MELFFLISGKLQNHRGMTQYFFSLKTSSFYIYRFTYIPHMFLNHVEVYFEYEHARDIVGTWVFSLNIDTLYVIVTLRTIVSTGICKYGQLFFELKRFISFYWRISWEPFIRQVGKPMCVWSCNKNNKQPIKNKNAHVIAT